MTQEPQTDQDRLLVAIVPHVTFDGWSETAFRMAAQDCGMTLEAARAICPRGAVDLAVACHQQGDARMLAALRDLDLSELRFRDRVARAVQLRLQLAGEREVVRRASALFAMPLHSAIGARLIWGTCDHIWTALGDTSDDLNWYSKRAILSGVYSSSVLYWLGDESPEHARTWEFLDRRIDNVMQIEKVKAKMRKSPLTRPLMAGVGRLFAGVKAPSAKARDDLPGSWTLPAPESK